MDVSDREQAAGVVNARFFGDKRKVPPKAAVLSLHFSPGYASHMVATAQLLRSMDFDVTLVLQERYLSFADFIPLGFQIWSPKRLSGNPNFDVAFFCNAAVTNPRVAHHLRDSGTKVLYLFHEPDAFWNHFAEGLPEIVKLVAARYCSIAMLRHSSAVIVPSSCARLLYHRYFERYNRHVYTMPLLFDDEIVPEQLADARNERKYFAFIGQALKAHDFAGFLGFAKHAIRNGSSIPFLIATKSDLGQLLTSDKELSCFRSAGKIEIHHGKVLSVEEINGYHLKSFCVWNIYKCSTQSGVLPRAFMAGCPVVANRIGSFTEYVQVGVNGEFVDSRKPAEILQVVEGLRSRTTRYVDGCRKTFLNTFYYKANEAKLRTILGECLLTKPLEEEGIRQGVKINANRSDQSAV
ncbi:MAG TPA: hypothetical protein VMU53_02055 [Candidatus Sulfotelmatobacter sp.]|nr:hypothetical protein [Candidatus Sulfotelmatobacter sp.]